jgi:hypothetical protein
MKNQKIIFAAILSVLACFALSPKARAVSPPPDGGYANANTAEGEDALFSLAATAEKNTAIGFNALYTNTTGFKNTATGVFALYNNTTGDVKLNEFLKAQSKIQKQETTITELKDGMKVLTASLREQAAQIQKVSAQIEVSKFATGRIRRGGPEPQMVLNDQ